MPLVKNSGYIPLLFADLDVHRSDARFWGIGGAEEWVLLAHQERMGTRPVTGIDGLEIGFSLAPVASNRIGSSYYWVSSRLPRRRWFDSEETAPSQLGER